MNPLFLAIPSLLQTGLGLYQTIKGARQRDTQDAKMTLPPAFIEAENQLRAEASQTESPYSPYAEQLMQQQGQQAITGAKQVGTAGDILNTVSNVNYQHTRSIQITHQTCCSKHYVFRTAFYHS